MTKRICTYLFIYLSICVSISVFISEFMFISKFLSVFVFICISIAMSTFIYVSISVSNIYTYLPFLFYSSVYFSVLHAIMHMYRRRAEINEYMNA